MRIFNKFKQLNREIKLIIITALIASCIGVYATGECIIAATADDVSYNNTTVQAAIDDLFSMSENYCPPGYECTAFNYATDCNNNILRTTIPDNLKGLAKTMAEDAYLDNGKSEYISSCNGVNFNNISSDTNGKGIYEIASTKNDEYPIYYYRGAVSNNNVKFAGFCWKAIRTTDTGGVKLIYNGEPDSDGYCTNTTGNSIQIGYSSFNSNYKSPASIGYMYGTFYMYTYLRDSDLSTPYVFGNDVSYSNGTYTLIDTKTSTGTWSRDYRTLNNNHYTCLSTGTTCTSVYYIYYTSSASAIYITLTDGKKVEDALVEMFLNTNDSTAKTKIDTWYNNNLSSYTSYIEDTVYCNDRSISELGGWNPDEDNIINDLLFSPHTRLCTNSTPSLKCSRVLDRFTVSNSNGNGALTYPVGLITGDEMMYAGAQYQSANNTYYLYSNSAYWTATPRVFQGENSYSLYNGSFSLDSSGNVYSNLGIRPVISLKSTDVVEAGNGIATNPYIIKTS